VDLTTLEEMHLQFHKVSILALNKKKYYKYMLTITNRAEVTSRSDHTDHCAVESFRHTDP